MSRKVGKGKFSSETELQILPSLKLGVPLKAGPRSSREGVDKVQGVPSRKPVKVES